MKEFLRGSKVWYVTRKGKPAKAKQGGVDTESNLKRMEGLPIRFVYGGRPESNRRKTLTDLTHRQVSRVRVDECNGDFSTAVIDCLTGVALEAKGGKDDETDSPCCFVVCCCGTSTTARTY